MKWLAVIVAAVSLMSAGADAAKAASADPAAVYQMVVIAPATAAVSVGFFRINVATGQVLTVWGSTTTYAPTVEPAALPAGDYHLYLSESLDEKGNWNMVRMDSQSGRTWSLSGGGTAPFTWTEITAPK